MVEGAWLGTSHACTGVELSLDAVKFFFPTVVMSGNLF